MEVMLSGSNELELLIVYVHNVNAKHKLQIGVWYRLLANSADELDLYWMLLFFQVLYC